MLKNLATGLRNQPLLLLAGMLVFIGGGATDLVLHSVAAVTHVNTSGGLFLAAHLAVLVGMVLSIWGIVPWGAYFKR